MKATHGDRRKDYRQYIVLCDQTSSAFSNKDLVAKFNWCMHLTSFDQVGVRFKNGINFLLAGNLRTLKHLTACLIDHTVAERTECANLLAQFVALGASFRVIAGMRGCVRCRAQNSFE